MVLNRRSAGPRTTQSRELAERVAARLPASYESMVAAAANIKLDVPGFSMKVREEEWQKEVWRHYDICGEFRFAANRAGNALSRIRLYVADVDEKGNPGDETKDKDALALGESIFGGPAAKAEALRIMGVQNYVVGEGYIVAESRPKDAADLWYVVSPAELKRTTGGIEVKRPQSNGGGNHPLVQGQDLLMRVWTPHPRLFDVADSPARAVLPILREIERLTMLSFSQIDSRLISAGLLILKKGLDFPHPADKTGGLTGLMEMILEVAKAQLQGAGTAAGLVPILAEIEADNVSQAFSHIKFDTPLTGELKDKLDHAIRRLALGLDMNPEDLLGGAGASRGNHWSAWQVSEDTIKIFIEPVASRLCDALTQAYLQPGMKLAGKDPSKWTIWYDLSPLTTRPNRTQDAQEMYDRGLLSEQVMLSSAAFDKMDQPNPKERLRWMTWQLVKVQPQMLGDPVVAEILGYPGPIQVQPAPAAAEGDQGAPASGEPGSQDDLTADDLRGLPDTLGGASGQSSPGQMGEGRYAAMLPGAEQAVLRALELAGGRLLGGHGRASRGQFAHVEKYDLHTRLPVKAGQASELLRGAFPHLAALALHYRVPAGDLEQLLTTYCAELLNRAHPHNPELLQAMLERADKLVRSGR